MTGWVWTHHPAAAATSVCVCKLLIRVRLGQQSEKTSTGEPAEAPAAGHDGGGVAIAG